MASATEALMDPQIDVDSPVSFAPRRIGHMNLFISNLARSVAFYQDVCGLETVGRSDGTGLGFFSNGNTHHDVGCLLATGRGLVGPDGHVQVPKERGHSPGLNHIGWEMENEWELVQAYKRATAAGVKIHRTCDHAISRSVYVFDPDGFLHEIYADTVLDWRGLFRDRGLDGLTTSWVPGETPPSTDPRYDPTPDFHRVPTARYHAERLAGITLLVRNYSRMRNFYINVMGLKPRFEFSEPRVIGLGGSAGGTDVILIEAQGDATAGMHHFSLVTPELPEVSLQQSSPTAEIAHPEVYLDLPYKRSVFLRDPDDMLVELFAVRPNEPGRLGKIAPHLANYAF